MNERMGTRLSLVAEAVIPTAYADKLKDRRSSRFVADNHVPNIIESIGLGWLPINPTLGVIAYGVGKGIEFGIVGRKKLHARRSRL